MIDPGEACILVRQVGETVERGIGRGGSGSDLGEQLQNGFAGHAVSSMGRTGAASLRAARAACITC